MRHLTIAFAAVAMTALFAAPVSAERIQGGPIKQNGQCWKSSKASEAFGHWRACPQPASGSASVSAGLPRLGDTPPRLFAALSVRYWRSGAGCARPGRPAWRRRA